MYLVFAESTGMFLEPRMVGEAWLGRLRLTSPGLPRLGFGAILGLPPRLGAGVRCSTLPLTSPTLGPFGE